ncbi:hypothetical protein [Ralstonia pickettii]|uniref:hypothetical protein n=1 Tax=Ralstonia pickettii TaxID=329 RepID=UPI000468E029|nr:hypothetical protein [Ralstonia pickettii]
MACAPFKDPKTGQPTHTPLSRLFAFGLDRTVRPPAHPPTSPASTPLTSSALQLLNKHLYQADRYTGMLIVLQHDAKEPAVISSGTYRRERARALTDFARASVQISELIEAGV